MYDRLQIHITSFCAKTRQLWTCFQSNIELGVYIGGNPWHCTMALCWYFTNVNAYRPKDIYLIDRPCCDAYHSYAKCAQPSVFSGTNLRDLTAAQLFCRWRE